MLFFVFVLLEIFLVSVQTTLLPYFPRAIGQPDLIFIFIAFISYRFDWISGLGLVLLMGWMLDVVSSLYLGVYLIQYLVVFIALKSLSGNNPLREDAYQIPLTAVVFLISQFILYFFLSQVTPLSDSQWSWMGTIQDTIILLIATVPCFLFYNLVFEFFSKRRTPVHKVRRSSKEEMDI